MKGTASPEDDRVVEELVAPVQLREVWDPLAEQHRHEADTDLIHQAEVECLLGDLRARDGDVLVAGDKCTGVSGQPRRSSKRAQREQR